MITMNKSSFSANEIPLDEARGIYQYNADTGEVLKVDGVNLKKIGWLDSRGYLCIRYNSTPIKVHRLAYALHHGEWPDNELDHINRNKLDNRISNLRLVNRYINNQNREFKPKWNISRKWEIFNSLLTGFDPSAIQELERYFPYSFKNG
jgi:hypothetical protein